MRPCTQFAQGFQERMSGWPLLGSTVFPLTMAFVAMLVLAPTIQAQETGQVAGQVTNANTGQPLEGAQLVVQGTQIGGLTDSEGQFSLRGVPTGDQVVAVQLIGYRRSSQSVTVQAGQTATVNFELERQAVDMDEIVVTGTGAPTERRQLGQTISSVDTEQLEDAPVQNVTETLQGRIPGMTGASLGYAGSAARIRLRGTVSLSQRNEPLIYIDGVRIDNSFNDVGTVTTSQLNNLDPNNIERIEVIKGAAAATLFGTEASSGVIQIFTKRGMVSEPVYNFRLDQTVSSIDVDRIPRNHAYDPQANEIVTNHPAADYIEPAYQQQLSATVRGGTPNVRYFASGRAANSPGSMPITDVDNYSLRTTLDFQHSDDLSTGWDVNIVRNNLTAPHPTWGLMAEFTLADPSNTSPERPYGEQDFTVEGALDFTNEEVSDNRTISGNIEYTWTPELNSTLTVGVNEVNVEETTFIPRGGGNPAAPSPGNRDISQQEVTSWTADLKNNFEYQLTDAIESTTVFGGQSFWETTVQQNVGVTNFPAPSLRTLRGGSTVSSVDEFQEEVINAGVFVQEQLGVGDRLFLNGGLRMDGNSAFGDDFGFQLYPKGGASWVVSDESFWEFDTVNQLRLRFAYGSSGLQPGAFDAVRTWRPASMLENQQTVLPLNLGNPDLKPERSTEMEAGIEGSVFDGQVGFNVVYFTQDTKDALLPSTVSPSLGFLQSQVVNIGKLESEGVEISANWTALEGEDFSLNLEGAYSYTDQIVTEMGDVADFRIQGRRRWSHIAEGYPPGAVLAPVHDPDNPYNIVVPIEELSSPSQIQPNWLKTSTGADSLVHVGNSVPTWNANFGATMELPGNLRARALLRAEGGFLVSNETELIRQSIGYNEFMAEFEKALDPDNDVSTERKREMAEQYAMQHPNMFSDWMEDGDYLKLQEVSLSWRVPSNLSSSIGLGSTSVTVNGRSLALWTGYSGIIDPGTGRAGRSEFLQNIDYFGAPVPRRIGLTIRTAIE